MFLDLRIVKELWVDFSEVRILQGFRNREATDQVPCVRITS
jgi:hypothetical protein